MSVASQMLETYPKDLGTVDRTNLDCADVCDATGRVLSRHTDYDANITRAVLEACAAACKACGTSASSTPTCTSTAACAPRPVVAASEHVGSCSHRRAGPSAVRVSHRHGLCFPSVPRCCRPPVLLCCFVLESPRQ